MQPEIYLREKSKMLDRAQVSTKKAPDIIPRALLITFLITFSLDDLQKPIFQEKNRGWENRTLYFYPLKMGKSLDLQGFPAFRNLIPLIPFDTPGYQILKTNRFIQLFEFCWFALIAVIIIVFRDRDIRVSHKPSLFCQIENERKANLSSWNLEMLRVREERKKQGYTNSPELNIIDTDSSITDYDLTL